MPSIPPLLSPQIRTLQTWEYPHLCPVGILPLSLFLPLFLPVYPSVLLVCFHFLNKACTVFLPVIFIICFLVVWSIYGFAQSWYLWVHVCLLEWHEYIFVCMFGCVFMIMCVFQPVSMTWLVQKVSLSPIRSPETGRLAPPRPWTVNGTSVLRHAPRLVT